MIMKLAGARGHASRYSPEQSLTVDCLPSSEPVSARAAMVRSARHNNTLGGADHKFAMTKRP
jgi:hypothetical protein